MKTFASLHTLCLMALCVAAGAAAAGEPRMPSDLALSVPENLYTAELVSYPGPWAFHLPRAHIIMVSDQDLIDLSDPDKVINMTLTHDEHHTSLRQTCEDAQARGARTLILAYDHFFAQYRPGQHEPRKLTPDMDEYIERIGKISRFAAQYGLGLELSLLSPLEIGPAYMRATGEAGRWLHYRKGVRDPESGAYSVQLWQQRHWANNKGPIEIEDAGVRVFAFNERPVPGTHYLAVDPDAVVEITDSARVEVFDGLHESVGRRIRVHGAGGPTGFRRVLVVQHYRVPEMDYFSERALPYLTGLVDSYADADVRFNAFYSDEMHIQQDWAYFDHHDNGEFALRYVSEGLERRFAQLYGEQYADLAKYMLFFCYGQEDSGTGVYAKHGAMHVMGPSVADIRRTELFRSRYYELLQDGVVDLFLRARRHAEQRMGHQILTRAHATWAESPTIDRWDVGRGHHPRHAYEYTPDFVWSCTVHQAAAACHDYFKWGDYLTGNGTDHPEGGWLDRNYYGCALACSMGILNEIPYSYCAGWGMPDEVADMRNAVVAAYGAAGSPLTGQVQGLEHRDVEVLMLYPLDLVAVEERFGSWMSQYGYANLVTQAKLIERGTVRDGAIEMGGRRFTTLVAQFEPLPDPALLPMMRGLAEGGGRVIWSGPPPFIDRDGEPVLDTWQDLFAVDYQAWPGMGDTAPGRIVDFSGILAGVPPQTILSDFMVDRIYKVQPREGADVVARVAGQVVGTRQRVGRGSATFLGFRPRDDQSASLGYETRTWFEVLHALGAYPPTGAFPDINDNTEYLSRTTPYIACRFPNGAVAIAPHYRSIEEAWPGGFGRRAEEDAEIMKRVEMPSDRLELRDFAVNGHRVTFDGRWCLCFRLDEAGELIGCSVNNATELTIDGRTWRIAEKPNTVSWAPVSEPRRVAGGALLQVMAYGTGAVYIPAANLPEDVQVFAEGPAPGSRGAPVKASRTRTTLQLEIDGASQGRWLYVVGR